MWTQEWSDIPSRSDWICAMCHQPRTSSSPLRPVEQRLEAAVAAGRHRDLGGGDRLGGRAAELAGAARGLLRSARRRVAEASGRDSTLAGVASEGVGRPSCPETGLAVPECSCRTCLETMLREFGPAILAEEIRIHRAGERRDGDEPGTAEHREAA